MRDRFDRSLHGLLPGSGAVLLAVSGGIDSMVMADLFLNSSFKNISLAHCNFHLRGEESDADESFVRGWAEAAGIPFFKTDFDTYGYASAKGISLEMAARELRYAWFASLCEEKGYVAVAVAHNANDNAETLILNLLRGTGLKGLTGMRELSSLPGSSSLLLRPLLGFSRDEIREYALAHGVSWREDSTNSDSSFKRNLIRNEVFPIFKKVNPSFLETLNADMRRFAQAQAVADDFFTSSIESSLITAAAGEPEIEGVRIDIQELLRSPHWEYLLFRVLEPYGFNEAVIGDLIALIKSGATFSGREFHSPTHVAVTSRNQIAVSSSEPAPAEDMMTPVLVSGPGEYVVGGVGLKVEVAEIEDTKQPEGLSAVNLSFPFTVRLWRPGDWMRPLGMKGRKKKLSDMFGDLKFSSEQKERALVIAGEGSHVLALVGYRIDESVALPDLELERKAGEHQLAVTLRPGPLPFK